MFAQNIIYFTTTFTQFESLHNNPNHISQTFKESALWADSFYKSKCPYVCLCVSLSAILSHSISRSFCPHFLKSNVPSFWFSESLGKRNGKKWYQILKLLLIKGIKSPWRKSFFYRFFSHLFTFFKRLFAPTSNAKIFRF